VGRLIEKAKLQLTFGNHVRQVVLLQLVLSTIQQEPELVRSQIGTATQSPQQLFGEFRNQLLLVPCRSGDFE
jgi:hypothetical protein